MASNAQPLTEKVACSICGKELDPAKPLREGSPNREVSGSDEFFCVECWLRALRTKMADSVLAKALDRVLMRPSS
jgi:hypothetical protein